MDFISTIADAIFGWVLDANASDYAIITNLEVPAWTLIMLIVITVGAAASFYYGVAKVAANATKKNYITVFLLGLLVVWLVNLIIIPTIVDDWEYAFQPNNILLSLVDSLYYAILYEIVSVCIKDKTVAKHIHLLNCFS